MTKISITEVKEANPKWFEKGTKRFFGDISYKTMVGRKTKKTYMVRLTNAWTDMFGAVKRAHYRINPINTETFDIEPLVEDIFSDMDDVKDWLKEN